VGWFREWLWGESDTRSDDAVAGRDGERPAPSATTPSATAPSASTDRSRAAGTGRDRAGRAGATAVDEPYPGQDFGLPEHGRDSVATLPLRGGQFLLDLVLAGVVAAAIDFPAPPYLSLAVWVVLVWPSVALLGQTPAMVLLGMRVARVDGALRVGLAWALARTVSLFFVLPACFVDHDARGLQDRISRTIVLRTR
jgi:hypothetical protein